MHRQLRKWHGHATDEELLAELAAFMARSPDVSTASLRGDPRMRCATTYAKRFGSLKEAYRLIGYVKPRRDPEEIRQGRNARRRARDAQTALARRQAKPATS